MRTSKAMFMSLAAAALAFAAGCTDRGEGLLGAGPDDRKDRGGGPDTVSVYASADTYYERGVDNGSRLLAGAVGSEGFEAVTFLRFDSLPAATDTLTSAALVLYSDAEILRGDDYDVQISRLEEPAPGAAPYWPGPPDGTDIATFANVVTEEDTTSAGIKVYALKLDLPVDWLDGWREDPGSNYGVRISGGSLRLLESGNLEPRFRSAGQVTEGDFSLSPRLTTTARGREEPAEWNATTSFFILKPTLDHVGELQFVQVGDIFGYRLLLRFPVPDSLAGASVNKALLTLKVDRSRPGLNDGVFDVLARPVLGDWDENAVDADLGIDPASSSAVLVDAEEDAEIELDVTALVEAFADSGFFNVVVLRSSETPVRERLALLSSEAADSTDAPFLKLVYTTPPGGRFAP